MPEHEEQADRADGPEAARTRRPGSAAAAARMQQQHTWVDLQVRQAMERGEFDDLPGAGEPIRDLGSHHDPDWWVKQLVERERITGVLPPSLQLRKDDAELDDHLDELGTEHQVREQVEDFNARVIRARYQPAQGPPLVTMPRDVEATVAAWRERRRARLAAPPSAPGPETPRRRRWFRRERRHTGGR